MNWIALFISSTCFSGFLPGKLINKPGSGGGFIGSVVGFCILVWSALNYKSPWFIFLIIIFSFLLGVLFIDKAENFMLTKWGRMRKHSGNIVDHDFNQTNIDEVHGQLIAGWPIFFFPDLSNEIKVYFLVFSLILFRIFDVNKLGYIKKIENSLDGSLGIMLDDSAAGLSAASVIFMVLYFFF